MISIKVNHEQKNIAANASLNALLSELNITKQGIAVAINDQIITKSVWETTALKENDAVTIIQATQGG